MAELRAVLQGVDEGLEDALEDVAQASEAVGKSLDDLDDTLSEISVAMEGAQEAAENATEGLNDTTQAAEGTDRAVSQASDEFRNAIGEVRVAAESLDKAARSFVNVGATAEAAETGVDRMADESREAAGSNLVLMQANELLSGSNIQTALTSDRAKEGIQDMGDAANNATGDLVGAASASELLNLQTSALSINVGAFTIALRNLTTEIPALVATLGNLSAGLFGVSGAFAAVGGAASALALGGFLAQAEQLAGPLEGAGNHLEAMGDIADNLKDTFIEAIQPLLETEGVIQVFQNAVEDVANIVQSFAEVIQYTFEESFENVDGVQLQSLAETMKGISDAIMDNIDEITAAIGDMVVRLGDDVVGMMETLFEALPGFIRGITVVTEELIAIFSSATGSLSEFTSELMELGRSIAAGVAPVLDTFFSIVADVAESINKLGQENIAAAAKTLTLLLAVNRLASMMGSIVLPITQAAGSLIKLGTEANNALHAFTSTVGASVNVTRKLSNGIDSLATAFEQVLPPIGEGTSLLDTLNEYIKGADGPLSALSDRLDDNTESANVFNSVIDSVSNKLSSFGDRFKFPDLGNAFRSMSADVESGDIISPTDLRQSVHDAFQIDQQMKLIDQRGAQESLSGLDAVKQRLVVLNDSFFDSLTQMEETVSNSTNNINSRFIYLARGVGSRVQSITDSLSSLAPGSLLPSSDDLIDQLMRPFNRVSEIDFAALVDAPFKRLNDMMDNISVSSFKSSLSSLVPSLDSVRTGINKVIMGETALSLSSIKSALSMDVLTLSSISLTSVLGTLATVAGVLTGALLVLVVAVGSVGAVLATIGASGKSAKDIMDQLRNTLVEIGETVMPAVVGASEMMLNIFRSIAAPVKALIDGFKEIGVALGLIEESAGNGGGMMGLLDAAVQALLPVMDIITELSLLVGGILTEQIEEATEGVVGLIEEFNVAQVLSEIFGTLLELVGPALNLLESFGGVFKSIFGSILPVLQSLISAAIGFYTFLNQAIGGLLSGLLGVENGASGATGVLIGGFGAVVDVVSGLMGAFAGVADMVATVIGVAGPLLASMINIVSNIAGTIAGPLIGAFETLGSVARSIMTTVKDAFMTALGPIIDGLGLLIDGFKRGIQEIANRFQGLVDFVADIWNSTLGGTKIDVPGQTINYPGGSMQIGGFTLVDIPTIGNDDNGDGGGGGGGSPALSRQELSGDDIATGANVVKQGAQSAMGGMGRNPNVTVDEGDTTNVFNQNISANPEDKAQIGRIAKDAMEEANSFKRRQQGGQ